MGLSSHLQLAYLSQTVFFHFEMNTPGISGVMLQGEKKRKRNITRVKNKQTKTAWRKKKEFFFFLPSDIQKIVH